MTIPRDKLCHAGAGALVCLLIGLLIEPVSGLAAAVILGGAKEAVYDAERPDGHTVDGWDAWTTALGAVPVALILMVVA